MARRQTRRAGYTMVELMVVIMIIVMLVSLLLAALSKVNQVMARTEVMSDITQMSQSLEAAKAGYNPNNPVNYLPSQLILFNDISKYSVNLSTVAAADRPLAKRTADVLRSMFGRRLTGPIGKDAKGNDIYANVNWGGTAGTAAGLKLKGSECLVFYLGGMPDPSGKCLGFAKDPLNPTASGGDRVGPFFSFKSNRLAVGPSGAFLRYRDPYGTPYAYFGAYAKNDYAPAAIFVDGSGKPTSINTDNSDLGLADAYNEGGSPKRWLSPDTFQIVSAGKDKSFGTGGLISVSNGSSETATQDNLANFSQSELGNAIE